MYYLLAGIVGYIIWKELQAIRARRIYRNIKEDVILELLADVIELVEINQELQYNDYKVMSFSDKNQKIIEKLSIRDSDLKNIKKVLKNSENFSWAGRVFREELEKVINTELDYRK